MNCEACDVPLTPWDTCERCGVLHGNPCEACGRRGYHTAECRVLIEADAQARIQWFTFKTWVGRHLVEVDAMITPNEPPYVSRVWLGKGARRRNVFRRLPFDVLNDINEKAISERAAYVESRRIETAEGA